MTRRQLGENMSAAELEEWRLYFDYRHRETERQKEEAEREASRVRRRR